MAEVSKDRRERHSGFFCAEHCPVCTPLFTEFEGKAETVSGIQEVLF